MTEALPALQVARALALCAVTGMCARLFQRALGRLAGECARESEPAHYANAAQQVRAPYCMQRAHRELALISLSLT